MAASAASARVKDAAYIVDRRRSDKGIAPWRNGGEGGVRRSRPRGSADLGAPMDAGAFLDRGGRRR
jgi:hypothetical protein